MQTYNIALEWVKRVTCQSTILNSNSNVLESNEILR